MPPSFYQLSAIFSASVSELIFIWFLNRVKILQFAPRLIQTELDKLIAFFRKLLGVYSG